MSNIRLAEAAAPSTPASGKVIIYAKTDGLVYGKDDAGTETQLSNGSTIITLKASVATTSGTYADITSIPSGTKYMVFSLYGVSSSGTSNYIVQIGDSGGIETTGYTTNVCAYNGSGLANKTDGWHMHLGIAAAGAYYGSLILSLVDSSTNSWQGFGQCNNNNSAYMCHCVGGKDLSAELTQIRFTTTGGSDTFDAGKIGLVCMG